MKYSLYRTHSRATDDCASIDDDDDVDDDDVDDETSMSRRRATRGEGERSRDRDLDSARRRSARSREKGKPTSSARANDGDGGARRVLDFERADARERDDARARGEDERGEAHRYARRGESDGESEDEACELDSRGAIALRVATERARVRAKMARAEAECFRRDADEANAAFKALYGEDAWLRDDALVTSVNDWYVQMCDRLAAIAPMRSALAGLRYSDARLNGGQSEATPTRASPDVSPTKIPLKEYRVRSAFRGQL